MTYALNGPCIIGTTSTLVSAIGYINAGSVTSTVSITSDGSVNVGGSSRTVTIGGGGCVSMCASGTVGTTSSHVNSVLIGGVGTTISSSGVVCIGSSSVTIVLSPSSPKMFIKDNPVTIATFSTLSTPGVVSASNLSGGYIQFTTSGAYTFDTTVNVRNVLLDSTGTAFIGTPSPYFDVSIRNASGGTVTLSSGTGQTFLNSSSPYTLPNGVSLSFRFTFTSNTTMTVDMPTTILGGNGVNVSSPAGNVTLSTNVGSSGFRAVFTANVALGANSTVTGSWAVTSPGFNIGSNFNTGSGIYTVPGAGVYLITYQLASSSNGNVVSLVVSGVVQHSTIAGGTNSTPNGSCILSLTTGQTVLMNVRSACTAYYRANNLAGREGSTYFCIFRLS